MKQPTKWARDPRPTTMARRHVNMTGFRSWRLGKKNTKPQFSSACPKKTRPTASVLSDESAGILEHNFVHEFLLHKRETISQVDKDIAPNTTICIAVGKCITTHLSPKRTATEGTTAKTSAWSKASTRLRWAGLELINCRLPTWPLSRITGNAGRVFCPSFLHGPIRSRLN